MPDDKMREDLEAEPEPGHLDATAPKSIYLQIDPDGIASDRDDPFPPGHDVTWCAESMGGIEIEYVRADTVHELIAAAEVRGKSAAFNEGVELPEPDGVYVHLPSDDNAEFFEIPHDELWLTDCLTNNPDAQNTDYYTADTVRALIAAERERCAKVCESHFTRSMCTQEDIVAANELAAAIRGEK